MVQHVKISENDVNEVLTRYFKGKPYKLIKFSYAPISDEVNGFMSEHMLLKINVENGANNELKFFAKILANLESIVEFTKSGKLFIKEVQCYKFLEDVQRIYPDFDISFAPKYYFSRDEELIILEDLADSGYKLWSKSLDLDLEHIKLTLKATAKFHASSFIFEEIKSKQLGRRYQLIEDYGEWLGESLYWHNEEYCGFKYIRSGIKGLCALVDIFNKKTLTSSEFKSKLQVLATQTYEDIKPSKKFRNAWCNGDLWTKNVMFKYKNEAPVSCKIFDFQLQRYIPPAHDVVFMIYQTADRKMRQKYFDYLLDYYYDNLKNELKQAGFEIENILSKEEFEASIGEVFPTIKLTKSIYKSLSAVSKESFKAISANPEVYADITFGDSSEFIVKEFKNVKAYRDIMTVLLEDLEDLLTHQKITIENCHKILRRKFNTSEYELVNYEVVPFGENNSKLKIKLCLQGEITDLTFLVKEFSKEEFKFYYKILPEIIPKDPHLFQQSIANCYLIIVNELMVFDDYSSKGYKYLKFPVSDFEIIKILIRELAKFHVSGLCFEENQKIKLETYFGQVICSNESAKTMLPDFLTQLKLFAGPNAKNQEIFRKRATEIFNRKFENAKPSSKYRNTICHGSLWSNNILLQFEDNPPVDCVFVNFDKFRYNPPAYDLILFLYLTTERKFRSQYMVVIQDIYYSEISKIIEARGIHTENILPYQEFLLSCEDMKEVALAHAVVHFHQIVLVLDKNTESSCSISFDEKQSIGNDRFNGNKCTYDHVFRSKLKECIDEVRAICEN